MYFLNNYGDITSVICTQCICTSPLYLHMPFFLQKNCICLFFTKICICLFAICICGVSLITQTICCLIDLWVSNPLEWLFFYAGLPKPNATLILYPGLGPGLGTCLSFSKNRKQVYLIRTCYYLGTATAY